MLLWTLLAFLLRTLLSLRYKVQVVGLEKLNPKSLNKKDGILFLPNHSAQIDPLILFSLLWPKYKMRPLVIDYMFQLPIARPWMKLIKALSIPNFDDSVNQWKMKEADVILQRVAGGLKGNENFILWPAARLKKTGKEILGGASGAHDLVRKCPESNVVLIRTSGLWGSSFSCALTGRQPYFPSTLWKGMKTLLKNLLFFTPRRKILIEFEVNPPELPLFKERRDFNRFLENWYNRYPNEEGAICPVEPLQLVSYSFWKRDVPEPFQPKEKERRESQIVSEETRGEIYKEIRKILDKPLLELHPEMSLSLDLGMDSLNIAELITFLSHIYEVGELHPENLETVGDVLEIASGGRVAQAPLEQTTRAGWPGESDRPEPLMPDGATFPEVFLKCCQRMGNHAACGDDLVGVLSYKKIKRTALVLAEYFRTLPDARIAVLLPASVGTYLVILALQFARKVPVMLNWTLGFRSLEEMVEVAQVQKVISSGRFLERLSHADFGRVADRIELLEDIRKKLSLKIKLRGVLLSLLPPSWVLKACGLRLEKDDPAVILFTGGTEAVPKGVPLSHDNMLSALRGALKCIHFSNRDVLYGILPPFHSFGFVVTGFFPLLVGIPVAFYPDPTDSFALVEGVMRWKITIFCAAPSFLRGLLGAAKKDQLRSIRFYVSGAEKASPELVARSLGMSEKAMFLEGYGLTESATLVTMTRPGRPLIGVGQPLPDVEVCTIHTETQELLPFGAEGEVCLRAPSIFRGYLNASRSAFIEIQGKQWFRTGDIGFLDSEGHLILSGRLKRFIKIGGEMISLAAVEKALSEDLLARGLISVDTPGVAICADEKNPEKAQLILFSVVNIDREEANAILNRSGFSRLIKIASVKKIDAIPLMGTGKTNYRFLQTLT
jgi:long-chain-fatty-acid--[acyl-carrier-protein] ligase